MADPFDPHAEAEANAILRGAGLDGFAGPSEDRMEAAEPTDSERDFAPALDVAAPRATDAEPERFVIDGLQRRGTVLALVGEEGGGKTTATHQAIRELVRGEPVFGLFPPGQDAPSSVLFADTHQGEADVVESWRDMERRGLVIGEGAIHWWFAEGLDLSGARHQRELRVELERCEATYLVLDAGSHAVPDPSDDKSVRPLFDFLGRLMANGGLLGVWMTLWPRKRGSGDFGRRFDDVFGSREFKSRPSRILYLDGDKLTCWKDRGGHLHKLWPDRFQGRYPIAAMERMGETDADARPFRCVPLAPVDHADTAALASRAIEYVREAPGKLTKTELARRLGGRKEVTSQVVAELLASGELYPPEKRKPLYARESVPLARGLS